MRCRQRDEHQGTQVWGQTSPCHFACAYRFQWWLVPMPYGLLIFVYDEIRKLGVRCCPGSEYGDWGYGAKCPQSSCPQLWSSALDHQALDAAVSNCHCPLPPSSSRPASAQHSAPSFLFPRLVGPGTLLLEDGWLLHILLLWKAGGTGLMRTSGWHNGAPAPPVCFCSPQCPNLGGTLPLLLPISNP